MWRTKRDLLTASKSSGVNDYACVDGPHAVHRGGPIATGRQEVAEIQQAEVGENGFECMLVEARVRRRRENCRGSSLVVCFLAFLALHDVFLFFFVSL